MYCTEQYLSLLWQRVHFGCGLLDKALHLCSVPIAAACKVCAVITRSEPSQGLSIFAGIYDNLESIRLPLLLLLLFTIDPPSPLWQDP